jgi:hypothetical protein
MTKHAEWVYKGGHLYSVDGQEYDKFVMDITEFENLLAPSKGFCCWIVPIVNAGEFGEELDVPASIPTILDEFKGYIVGLISIDTEPVANSVLNKYPNIVSRARKRISADLSQLPRFKSKYSLGFVGHEVYMPTRENSYENQIKKETHESQTK